MVQDALVLLEDARKAQAELVAAQRTLSKKVEKLRKAIRSGQTLGSPVIDFIVGQPSEKSIGDPEALDPKTTQAASAGILVFSERLRPGAIVVCKSEVSLRTRYGGPGTPNDHRFVKSGQWLILPSVGETLLERKDWNLLFCHGVPMPIGKFEGRKVRAPNLFTSKGLAFPAGTRIHSVEGSEIPVQLPRSLDFLDEERLVFYFVQLRTLFDFLDEVRRPHLEDYEPNPEAVRILLFLKAAGHALTEGQEAYLVQRRKRVVADYIATANLGPGHRGTLREFEQEAEALCIELGP